MRWLSIVAAAVLLSACTSIHRLSSTQSFDPNTESVVVLGLQPDNHRIQIFPGTVQGDQWHEKLGIATFFGSAERGYVLAKAPNDTALAVSMIRVVADEKQILGTKYTPCGNSRTVVFQVPRGKVIYLADFYYQQAGDRLQLEYAADLARARRYVDDNFPALRGRLEQGQFSLMQTAFKCGGHRGTIYLPVFVPRK
jgi:hypothetical protein